MQEYLSTLLGRRGSRGEICRSVGVGICLKSRRCLGHRHPGLLVAPLPAQLYIHRNERLENNEPGKAMTRMDGLPKKLQIYRDWESLISRETFRSLTNAQFSIR